METTKNEMDAYSKNFFLKLGNYLDTQLYYYGSIQRNDYFPGKSDIDIDIFTDNEHSIMSKMQHFLGCPKSDFKSIVWVINKKPAYGYKLMYKNPEENIVAEFSIYNDKFKDMIIKEHTKKFVLPFYISIILYIVKFFYYTVPILPKKTYQEIKKFLLSRGIGEDLDKFIVLDSF
jgi:hypothetical protein